MTTELPAGSPFLADVRLQALLDLAHPVPLTPASTWPPLEAPARAHWATEWVALAREQSDAVLADWSRRWRESAGRRQAMGEQAERLLSEALDTALTVVGRIASRRRLKPR